MRIAEEKVAMGRRVLHGSWFFLSSASLCLPPCLRVKLSASRPEPWGSVHPNDSGTLAHPGFSRNFVMNPFFWVLPGARTLREAQ